MSSFGEGFALAQWEYDTEEPPMPESRADAPVERTEENTYDAAQKVKGE